MARGLGALAYLGWRALVAHPLKRLFRQRGTGLERFRAAYVSEGLVPTRPEDRAVGEAAVRVHRLRAVRDAAATSPPRRRRCARSGSTPRSGSTRAAPPTCRSRPTRSTLRGVRRLRRALPARASPSRASRPTSRALAPRAMTPGAGGAAAAGALLSSGG